MKPRHAVIRARCAACVLLALLAGALPRHAAASPPGAAPTAGLRVVYTQHDNVFLLDTASGRTRRLTMQGGHGDIVYPRYDWSPDGRYLLLVRGHQTTVTSDLLLLDRGGTVLRTLASALPAAGFQPSWAADVDRVAYVAATTPAPPQQGGVIDHLWSVDPRGRRAPLWTFFEAVGCGGGTPDPAEQLLWRETGFGSVAMTFTWRTAQHRAVFTPALCLGSVDVTDTRTGRTGPLGQQPPAWHEGVLAPNGATVAAMINPSQERTIVLAAPRPGSLGRVVAPGELPAWSRDGRTLYFVRRTPGPLLSLRDSLGNAIASQTYTTAIWQARADGSGPRRIAAFDAFGTGPLHVTPDGRSLVFARVDNSWALWRHRLAGDVVTPALQARYGPRVAVVRLSLDGTLRTLVADAGQPAVQP